MKAKIITIGDELLIGQVVNTNAAWIASRLGDAGVEVTEVLTVGDDAERIAGAVTKAMEEVEATVVTGGLGPTCDDITKKVLAGIFGMELRLHEPTYRHLERMLAERGIEFNELNRSQALLPDGCTVLPNANGTAPGMWFEQQGRVVVSLPGVPFEMQGIMDGEVLPRFMARWPEGCIVHRTAVLYGIPESELAARIEEWETSLPPFLHLAYLPSPSQMRLRLSSYDTDGAVARGEIDSRFAQLEKIVPRHFIGYGETTVQECVASMLRERGATLSIAESCTGGYLASLFTAMAGASDYFCGAVVSYSNQMKINMLNVDPEIIASDGAVSRRCAEAMALGVKKLTGSDYALATTGIAGPSGGSDEKPVGTVWIAVATPSGIRATKKAFGRLRRQNIERAAMSAVDMLRLALLDNHTPDTPAAATPGGECTPDNHP